MTKEELKNLKYRKMRLDDLKERIDILWTKITSITVELTDMPKGGGVKSELREEYCDLMDMYKKEKDHLELDITRAERWLLEISKIDSFISSALTKKYIDEKTWYQVALEMGGNNKEESVRKRCDRYLEREKVVISTM